MKTAPKLEKFEPLELNKCQTVGQILEAMSKTPVGSGMLGRLAMSLRELITAGGKPVIIFDGDDSSQLFHLVKEMKERRWIFDGPIAPRDYMCRGYVPVKWRDRSVLVLGRFSEPFEEFLITNSEPRRTFFVNQWGFSFPAFLRDGSFHNTAVADPCFVLPLLYAAFEEWFDNKPWLVNEALISWLEKHGGAGEEFGRGARVLKAMTDDPDCTVVFTATGVLTMAQMSPIVCDLIDQGKFQLMVTTGALLGHGLVYSLDLPHFRHDPALDDATLAKFKWNRITDAIEPETNLDHVEKVVDAVLKDLPDGAVLGSWKINRLIGEYLRKHFPSQRGILKSAAEKNVPVIIPAPYDSELGNDILTHNRRRKRKKRKSIVVNIEEDSELLIDVLTKAKRRGISTLGGGPPRNTPQNTPPQVEILNSRLGLHMPVPMYHYGCRVCPDPIWLGHLSGCTYSEGMSWRKMEPDGQFAEVHMDAMHVFPFLAKYIL